MAHPDCRCEFRRANNLSLPCQVCALQAMGGHAPLIADDDKTPTPETSAEPDEPEPASQQMSELPKRPNERLPPMSEVLTPQPGQTIVDTNHNRHHGDNELDRVILRETLSDFRVQSKATTDGFTAAALAACRTDDTVGNVKVRQAEIEGRALVEAAKNAAAAILEAAKNTAQLSVQVADVSNRASVQLADVDHRASVERTKFAGDATVQAVKDAAASALTAAVNQAATLAAIAECCCETKERIHAEGEATRSLINSNTIATLQAQIVATQRLVPTTIPVGA